MQRNMATTNLQTQKSFSSILLSISLTFLLLPVLNNKVVNSLESISFSFSKFSQGQQNLILQRDALITSTGKLQLTAVDKNGKPLGWSLGRALYSAPIHMWDSTTGNVASFVTTFSFLINTPNKAKMADGLAFFISPVDTRPQSAGGFLGIFDDRNHHKSNQTVAVEFDTLFNRDWDPTGDHRHIGIDVGSIKSISTVPWNFLNDTVADVVISYRAPTNVLTVTLLYPSVATSYVLSDVVSLKEVLPEWVSIGFSATTGLSSENVETNDILSWTFHSELRDSNDAHPSSSVLHEPI